MVCEAPASVRERGCEYRAYTSLWGDQDMVNVANTLKLPGECALCFPFRFCRRGETRGDQMAPFGPFTETFVGAPILGVPAAIEIAQNYGCAIC